MVDWVAHYAAIYATLGVPAVLAIGSADYDLTVVDKTAGIEVGDDVTVSSIKPAAAVRMTELASHGLSRADLNADAVITFNGVTWFVKGTKPRPAPTGEAGGEVYLILSE